MVPKSVPYNNETIIISTCLLVFLVAIQGGKQIIEYRYTIDVRREKAMEQ